MKMRKILLIVLALSLVLTLSLVGAMFAYMYKQTGSVTNTLVPANVACQVFEEFSGNTKTEIKVENTGNIDAYLRVRLVSYWVNDAGEIMPKESVMPAYDVSSDCWIAQGNHTYCYKTSIAPGGLTPNLLTSSITLGESEEGYRQVVEVFAEAIQAEPREAVEEAWSISLGG